MLSRSSSVSAASKSSKSKEDILSSLNIDIEKAAPDTAPQHAEPEKQNVSPDLFLARFEKDDAEDPYNFSLKKKIWLTAQLGLLAFIASLASAITAPAQPAIEEYTGVGSTAVVLTISLYVLGFVFGPSVWGPASEVWGRRWSLIPAMVGLGLFSIGTGASKNFASIAVCRFFSGFFGSGPVSNVSAAMGDIYRPKERGIAVSFYAVIVVGGPLLGPSKYIPLRYP
jgi:sugar phosphate permease